MEIKLISCPVCLHPHFNDIETLRLTLLNISSTPITCPVCSESFLGLEKFTNHLCEHVNEKNGPKEMLQKEIDKRIDSISEWKKNESILQSPPAEEVIKCDICSFVFTDRNILELHQKLLHQTCPDKTGTYNYHCHLCSKQFRMRGSLMVHLRIAHFGFVQNSTEERDFGDKKSDRNDHQKQNNSDGSQAKTKTQNVIVISPQDKKQWECDICTKTFTTKYFLKKHKRLHTGEMPYCCSLCNKSFTFQQSYHKHMLYHSSEKPHSCNECGRAFKELSTLQNHARIHSGERPFACETCGKTFRQRISYLVHRRIHTGVMPYKCNSCNKSFRYKVSQKSHKCTITKAEPTNGTERSQSIIADEVNVPNGRKLKQQAKISTTLVTKEDPTKQPANTFILEKDINAQKTCILVSSHPHIEISYNAADLKPTIQTHLEQELLLSRDLANDGNSGQNFVTPQLILENTTSVLTPIITNVEQLYLNGDPEILFLNRADIS